ARLIDIISKHPKRRPDSGTAGYFDPRLDAAISKIKFSFRYKSCRRVLTFSVPAVQLCCGVKLYCFDRQRSVSDMERVFFRLGIKLKLFVPPTASADLSRPFRRIDRCANL